MAFPTYIIVSTGRNAVTFVSIVGRVTYDAILLLLLLRLRRGCRRHRRYCSDRITNVVDVLVVIVVG
jgi:hypothetical protein